SHSSPRLTLTSSWVSVAQAPILVPISVSLPNQSASTLPERAAVPPLATSSPTQRKSMVRRLSLALILVRARKNPTMSTLKSRARRVSLVRSRWPGCQTRS
ncbi:hypothetical protein BGX34_010066, partial [Mortierella sp. NVP85]